MKLVRIFIQIFFLVVGLAFTFLRFNETSADVRGNADLETVPVIRLLVAYTPTVRGVSCSIGTTRSQIYQAVQEINQSFTGSAVHARLELAGVVEAEYSESGNLGADLQALQQGNEALSRLHDLRDQLGADLVSLIVASEAGCSDGYASFTITDTDLNPEAYAYSVVRENCMQSDLALAQAVGANLGARKDWYTDDSSSPSYYSHGYVSLAGGWRTIMSAEVRCANNGISCTHIPFWSNPEIFYLDGKSMGVAGTNVSCSSGYEPANECASDNARKLNERAPIASLYRNGSTQAWFPAQILLVNDVGSGATEVESYYKQAFEDLGLTFDLCSTGSAGATEPNALDLSPYQSVVWFSGDFDAQNTGPGYYAEIALSNWLDQGRCFMLSSQKMVNPGSGQLTDFMQDYLGVLSVESASVSTAVIGAGPFTGLGEYNLGVPDEFPPDWMVNITLQPQPDAQIAFQGNAGDLGLFKMTQDYRTAYLAFPLEMLSTDADRQAVLGRFMDVCRFNNVFMPLLQRP